MYRYWNLGWLVPPSAGAASGVLPNPVGYNRMYVKLDGEFSVEKWYQGVKAGQIMLSNGPVLFFEPRFDKGTLTGRIEATSRTELDRVELVANAKVIQRWKPSGKRFRAAMKVNVERYSWVAARCYEKNEATVRLRPHRSGQTGRQVGRAGRRPYVREWVEELQRNPRTPAGSKAAELYRQALSVYRASEKSWRW